MTNYICGLTGKEPFETVMPDMVLAGITSYGVKVGYIQMVSGLGLMGHTKTLHMHMVEFLQVEVLFLKRLPNGISLLKILFVFQIMWKLVSIEMGIK